MMLRRFAHAFRVAAAPSLAIAIATAFIIVTRWSKFANDPVAGMAIMSGLVLVVFLTYFVLAVTGFQSSPQGVVDAPRVFVWSVLCAIVVVVFGVLFYVLQRRG